MLAKAYFIFHFSVSYKGQTEHCFSHQLPAEHCTVSSFHQRHAGSYPLTPLRGLQSVAPLTFQPLSPSFSTRDKAQSSQLPRSRKPPVSQRGGPWDWGVQSQGFPKGSRFAFLEESQTGVQLRIRTRGAERNRGVWGSGGRQQRVDSSQQSRNPLPFQP